MRIPKFWRAGSVVAAVLISNISIPAQSEEAQTMTKDQQTVLSVINHMTSSFHAGDIDAVMKTYEARQSIAFEPGNPVSDAAIARQAFQQFSEMAPEFTYQGHEVIVEGDLAVHIAPWRMTAKGADGTDMSASGLSVAVLRRQSDGSWKMVIDNPYGNRLLAETAQ